MRAEQPQCCSLWFCNAAVRSLLGQCHLTHMHGVVITRGSEMSSIYLLDEPGWLI
jgi:hypothetical protein